MKGIKVFEGIAIGKALVYQETDPSTMFTKETIKDDQIQDVLQMFGSHVETAIAQLDDLKQHALLTVGKEEAEIFEAHSMMLSDPMLIGGIKKLIEKEYYSEAYAILTMKDRLVAQFMAIENEYIRARAQDVRDVSDRLLRLCLGIEEINLDLIREDTVIVAKDLKPSQTIGLNSFVKGIILEEGSVTSHAAIVAKAKGIPTLVGVVNACGEILDQEMVILDSKKNNIFVKPDEATKAMYATLLEVQIKEQEFLNSLKHQEAVTLDGRKVKLYGNVGSVEEARLVKEQGAKGIGLLRTELIYMNSDHLPTEEEQFRYYKEIAELMEEETIIRTLDIGGDKSLPYYELPKEENPFLGKRAIRLCLKEKALFQTQLKAILRASHFGKIKIMFPMISCLEELREAKEQLEIAKQELRGQNILFDENIAVGIMVEIPAAAICADLFAKEVDFFSIGTNDLCQYTMAVDRMNPEVSHLYQPLHPGILRLIQMTIDAGKKHHVEVGVCGETAGDKDFAGLLLGMGVDELSMSPAMINRVKDRIRSEKAEELEKMAEQVKGLSTWDQAYEIIKK